MGNREDPFCRLCYEAFNHISESITLCTTGCGSSRGSFVRSELVRIETERARTLGISKVVVQFHGGESRNFLAIERTHHRVIAVLCVSLVSSFDNRGLAKLESTDSSQKVGVSVY